MTRINPIRTVIDQRRTIGLSYRQLGLVSVLAGLSGLGQASILIIVVRVATALTADTEIISGTIGPISATDLSSGRLILMGFVILAGLLLVEVASSLAQASLAANAQRAATRQMLGHYSAADFDAQIALSRGDTQQILSPLSNQAAGLVSTIGLGLSSLVNFFALAGSALIVSPLAGLIVLGGLVVMLLALRPLYLVSRNLGQRRATAQRFMGSLLVERLELSREVRAFGVDSAADGPLLKQIDVLARINHRVKFTSRMASVVYQLGALALVLGILTLIDASDATNLASITGALLMLLRSLSYGQAAQSTFQTISETAPLIEQLATERSRFLEAAEPNTGADLATGHVGDIAFNDVSYSYPGGDPVLHNISFAIEQGDFLALVGPSGAGKSTIMTLLLGLRRPTSGVLEVDGAPLSDISLVSWRQRVAFVPQEPKLQSGTVAETIRFHRPSISDADIQRAAERAHIAADIRSWPDGFDTQVGQLGDAVSGGQRQRIALARALAGNPELLLLDEPTSALDPQSEQLIAQTLEELRGEMTIIVIAHRFHTVENANRVVLIEDGRVAPQDKDDVDLLRRFMGSPAVKDEAR